MDGQEPSLAGSGHALLAWVLDQHGPALELYARQWCDTPEDVVQEALLQLVRQRPTPHPVLPWLYRVVRNGAISAARSAQRRRRHETEATGRTQPWFQAAEGAGHDAWAATEAMRGLPVETCEVIVARLWGGMSFEEVGALVGVSSSTAHRRYEAGLAAIRERLGIECQTNTKTQNKPQTSAPQSTS